MLVCVHLPVPSPSVFKINYSPSHYSAPQSLTGGILILCPQFASTGTHCRNWSSRVIFPFEFSIFGKLSFRVVGKTASCTFSLLAKQLNPNWTFSFSEIYDSGNLVACKILHCWDPFILHSLSEWWPYNMLYKLPIDYLCIRTYEWAGSPVRLTLIRIRSSNLNIFLHWPLCV